MSSNNTNMPLTSAAIKAAVVIPSKPASAAAKGMDMSNCPMPESLRGKDTTKKPY